MVMIPKSETYLYLHTASRIIFVKTAPGNMGSETNEAYKGKIRP